MMKRQYLDLMGIDVWQERLPRQASARTVETDFTPVEGSLSAEGSLHAEGSLSAKGSSAVSVLADVKRTLQGGAQPVESPVVKEAVTQVAEEKPEPTEPAPAFLLTFSHFRSVTMVNIYPAGFAAIPGNHQRFLATLGYAMLGEKVGSEVQEFRWPMLKSDHISQSKRDAQQVLGRHLQQCQKEVLVFGDEAGELLAGVIGMYTETMARDRLLLVTEDIESYFREPTKRKDLWRFLAGFKQRQRTGL